MSYHPTTTVRIAPSLKKEANAVFSEMGLSMSAAINAFLVNVSKTGRLPFELEAEPSKVQPRSRDAVGGGPKNRSLNRAFKSKKDEFYTLYEDVEKELVHYSDKFTGKHVLCNCDDPFESAFFRYFILNFEELGLASLRSTCYASSPLAGQEYPLEAGNHPYVTEVNHVPEDLVLPDGSLDLETVFGMEGNSISWLDGDGDFRSKECVELLKTADVVVTNPPFSLFREFITQLVEYEKEFLILGNMNASTCREVFPLFKDNKVWYGQSIRSGDRKFYVPETYPLSAANCGIDDSGRRFIRVKGVRWFTNIDNARRHETLDLSKPYDPSRNPKFDNYNAIEVSRTMDIPFDYDGLMGVPITFLDRYNPAQFEIMMLANGNARTNVAKETLSIAGYEADDEDKGGVAMLGGKRSYARILVKRVAN